MKEQALLSEKQVHRKQTAAIWLYAMGLIIPIIVTSAMAVLLQGSLDPSILILVYGAVSGIFPLIFMWGCWQILLKFADSAGCIFVRRWM